MPRKNQALPLFPLVLLAFSILGLAGAQSVPSLVGGSRPGKEAGRVWSPPRGKYLLAICLYGRLTNQIMCMRDYLKLAQALNRTLLIPTWGTAMRWKSQDIAYDFRWNVPVDWGRMRACLAPHHGPRTVVSVRDYLAANPRTPKLLVTFYQGLTKVRSWTYPESAGMLRFQDLNQLELELPPRQQVPEEPLFQGVELRESLLLADVVRAVEWVEDEVMTVGEMFMGMPAHDLPPLRIADKRCSNLWHAHPGIMIFVDGVIGSMLGDRNYAALHLRRGDFYMYMSQQGKKRGPELAKEFPSVVDFAKETRDKMLSLNLSKLYVASNARKTEMDLFKAVIAEPINSSKQTAVSLGDVLGRRGWVENQPWAKAALEMERMPGTNGLVLSLIDKFLCVKAAHFWGSQLSTFSLEVHAFLRPDEHV